MDPTTDPLAPPVTVGGGSPPWPGGGSLNPTALAAAILAYGRGERSSGASLYNPQLLAETLSAYGRGQVMPDLVSTGAEGDPPGSGSNAQSALDSTDFQDDPSDDLPFSGGFGSWSVDPQSDSDSDGRWSAETGGDADCGTAGGSSTRIDSDGHPGFWESMIPVWGSGREATADAQEGNYIGAGLNAVLAVSDLFPAEDIYKGLAKGGFKLAGSHTWDATRKWLLKRGFKQAGEHGHHWLIPRNGWGKPVPDWIKNQPWNIKALSPELHRGVHGANVPSLERRMNFGEKLWYATPDWAKAVVASAGGHAALAGENADQ